MRECATGSLRRGGGVAVVITWQFGNRLLLAGGQRGGVVVRLRLEIGEGVVRQVVRRLEGGVGQARAQPPSELWVTRGAQNTTGVRYGSRSQDFACGKRREGALAHAACRAGVDRRIFRVGEGGDLVRRADKGRPLWERKSVGDSPKRPLHWRGSSEWHSVSGRRQRGRAP